MLAERNLWHMVLLQSVFDVLDLRPTGASPRERKRLAIEARAWFESPQRGVGSFHWIVSNLDLDVTTVRRKVFSLQHTTAKARMRRFIKRGQPRRKQRPISTAA